MRDDEESIGACFYTERSDIASVTEALRTAGWSVTRSEMGYRPEETTTLDAERLEAAEAFLEAIDDHDDCHSIYTTLA